MKAEQLNILVAKARGGCKDSYYRIEAYFSPFIEEVVNRYWHELDDYGKFEETCRDYIRDSIKRFDESKGSFETMVKVRISKALRKYIQRAREKRKRYGPIISLENAMSKKDDDDGLTAIDIIDVKANVDQEFIVKEEIAFLAEGDPRKLAILEAWMNGEYNDSKTAMLLAQRHGGNPESHRKFITRFRTKCRAILATIA